MTRNAKTSTLVGMTILAICGTIASADGPASATAAQDAEAQQAQFVPMPLAVVDPNTVRRDAGPQILTRTNLLTGEVTHMPIADADASIQDLVNSLLRGGSNEDFFAQVQRALGSADEAMPANRGLAEFGDEVGMGGGLEGGSGSGVSSRVLVANPSLSGNARNCKITYNFGTTGHSCSAIMIDPKWCMTAGHCAHSSDAPQGNSPANTYASNIKVYPGYNNGENPLFGSARGIFSYTLSGWRHGADYDSDIAFIELDRPIGALSGLAGFSAFNGETGLIFSGTRYNVKGYPGQNGYNGSRMYSRDGDFDMSWGHTYYHSSGSIPGESGSGYTRTTGVAQAVVSHSISVAGLGFATGATAVWSSLYRDIRDNNILARTPVAADLIPLRVQTATTSRVRGTRIASVSFVIHNYSRSTFSGTPIISTRFSANEYITTADAQGSVHSAGFMTIAPKASRTVTISNVLVPANAPTGNVYLGVIINNADANNTNNESMPVDTDRLLVN